MNDRHNSRSSSRVPSSLTVKLPEFTGPLPPVALAPGRPSTRQLDSRRSHRRLAPSDVITRIAEDAARGCSQASIESVAPADGTDPLLLFLRRDGETRLVLGVPSAVVRSPRLRGESHRRHRDAEQAFELMRVAEAQAEYEVEPFVDNPDDDIEL